jgi:hypothetical protein
VYSVNGIVRSTQNTVVFRTLVLDAENKKIHVTLLQNAQSSYYNVAVTEQECVQYRAGARNPAMQVYALQRVVAGSRTGHRSATSFSIRLLCSLRAACYSFRTIVIINSLHVQSRADFVFVTLQFQTGHRQYIFFFKRDKFIISFSL